MRDKLQEICAAKREHVARRKKEKPEARLLAEAEAALPPRGFVQALRAKADKGGFGLIAEIKKASPSVGVIRPDFDPAALARAYAQGGAVCLSVLTDESYFQGRDEYLAQARDAASLPVLRKDFMLDPYQIVESRALGADCVLLIMAALPDAQAAELHSAALGFGMDALVEVHDMRELERALRLNPAMIGVNNRDLKTLKVDLAVSETLARHMSDSVLAVAESGISTHADMMRLAQSGYRCFLVGETLMRAPDVERATRQLLGAPPC